MWVEITGKMAMFTNPIFKTERVSYPVPPPGAIAGCLKQVYWKPEMRYVIDEIRVINRPRYRSTMQLFRTKVFDGAPVKDFDPSVPRNSLYLRDVRYFAEFHVELTGKGDPFLGDSEGKHLDIVERRLKEGQEYNQPFLGTRECACSIELVEDPETIPESELRGSYPLPIMSMGFSARDVRVFFHPVMTDGRIDCRDFSCGYEDPLEEGDFLKNLLNFYDMHQERLGLPPDGFAFYPVTWKLTLDELGCPVSFAPLEIRKDKPASVKTLLPISAPKSSNISASYLWGGLDYLLGWGDTAKGPGKLKAFMKKLSDVSAAAPCDILYPVLDFYASLPEHHDKLCELTAPWFDPQEAKGAGNVIFAVEGRVVTEDPEVIDGWLTWLSQQDKGGEGLCLVTGKTLPLAKTHALVKGVAGSSGMGRLISIDAATPSLFSYGKVGLENAPISADASFKIHSALNWLLSQKDHKVDLEAGGTLVFWTRNDQPKFSGLMNGIFEGSRAPAVPDGEPVYLLWLRPNGTGRVFVQAYERLVTGDPDFYDCLVRFLLGTKAAINLKALRQWEGESDMITEKSQGYQLGKLFAQIKIAQMDAIPSTVVNGGIEKTYFELCSLRPQAGFTRVLSLMRVYLQKADFGIGAEIADTLCEIEKFDVPYPPLLDPSERALFSHGYLKNFSRLKEERKARIEEAMKKKKKASGDAEETDIEEELL